MTRHFTYEIDERNLRVKLKDMEMPFNGNAWESFEQFSDRQKKNHVDNGVNLKFSLNRNVITLAVFGVVIVSFSLLLFNFISIKNPRKETVQSLEKTAILPTENPGPKPSPPIVKAAPVPSVAPQEMAVTATENSVPEKTVVPEPAPVAEEKKTIPVAEKKKEATEEELSGDELLAREKQAEERRLKKERRAAAALAKSIRPTVIMEDNEPDVKPQ